MRISSNVVLQNMMSHDTDNVVWGNIDDLTRNTKTSGNSKKKWENNFLNKCKDRFSLRNVFTLCKTDHTSLNTNRMSKLTVSY